MYTPSIPENYGFRSAAYQHFYKIIDSDIFEEIELGDPQTGAAEDLRTNMAQDSQTDAAEGLLRLSNYRCGSDNDNICDGYPTPSDSVHPLQPVADCNTDTDGSLKISNLLNTTSPRNSTCSSIYSSSPIYQHYNSSWGSQLSYNSSSKLLNSPSDDGASTATFASPYSQPLSSSATLVEPLSSPSSAYSSIRSTKTNRSLKIACSTKKKENNFLSRAATFTRHRGRPKKNTHVTTETMAIDESITGHAPIKPRWQDSEKRELIEAIVKDKQLDDMTTIHWDRISMTVGKAKKACKDQWRRVLLPDLLKRIDGSSSVSSDPKHHHYSDKNNYGHQQQSSVNYDHSANRQHQSDSIYRPDIIHQQQNQINNDYSNQQQPNLTKNSYNHQQQNNCSYDHSAIRQQRNNRYYDRKAAHQQQSSGVYDYNFIHEHYNNKASNTNQSNNKSKNKKNGKYIKR